jgi:hypothetical protein
MVAVPHEHFPPAQHHPSPAGHNTNPTNHNTGDETVLQ